MQSHAKRTKRECSSNIYENWINSWIKTQGQTPAVHVERGAHSHWSKAREHLHEATSLPAPHNSFLEDGPLLRG